MTIPKQAELLKRADGINNLLNRPWTEQELNEKVKIQNEIKNKFNGVFKLGLEGRLKEAKTFGSALFP